MTEFELAIEKARREHEEGQKYPAISAYESARQKLMSSCETADDRLRRLIGYEDALKQLYLPLIMKCETLAITSSIFDILRESRICETKKLYREYQSITAFWNNALTSQDVQIYSKECIEYISFCWMCVCGKKLINKLQKEVQTILESKNVASGNTLNILSWVFTIIDVANISDNIEYENINRCNRIIGIPLQRRNPNDIEQKVKKILIELAESFIGSYNPIGSKKIDRIKAQIKEFLLSFDVNDYLTQFSSIIKRGCDEGVCVECKYYPCETLKEERKESKEYIESVDEKYGLKK